MFSEIGTEPCSTNVSSSSKTERYEAEQSAYFEFRCAVNYTGSWVPSLRCKPLGMEVDATSWINSSSNGSNSVSYTLRARAPSNMKNEMFECGVRVNGRLGDTACRNDCTLAHNVPQFYRQLVLYNITFDR